MDHQIPSTGLLIKGEVVTEPVLPIDTETQKVDIELPGLVFAKNPNQRYGTGNLHCPRSLMAETPILAESKLTGSRRRADSAAAQGVQCQSAITRVNTERHGFSQSPLHQLIGV
jgi:hypothetical protein